MIAAAIASAASPVVASAPRYKLAKSVSLGAPDRWDFVHFDPVQNCVYVAHRTQIDVIDGKTGAIVGRVAGIAGAHDGATVPALGRGYADNSDTGDVTTGVPVDWPMGDCVLTITVPDINGRSMFTEDLSFTVSGTDETEPMVDPNIASQHVPPAPCQM